MIFVISHQGRLEYFLEPLVAVKTLFPVAAHPAPSLRTTTKARPRPVPQQYFETGDSPLGRRITCIKKKGNFLFVGHEGHSITVWNIDKNHQVHYIREYTTEGQVLDLKVQQNPDLISDMLLTNSTALVLSMSGGKDFNQRIDKGSTSCRKSTWT